MSENNTDGRRIWFIVLPIIFILFLAGVVLASVIIPGLTTEQRIDYGIKALTTTGTIFAGIAVFINAFYAGKNSEALNKSAIAANESAKAALKNAEAALKNAVIAEDKQITERFAKAIEQLGSEKIEVRLGAIYTLERIAKDSAKDHWTIMEVLTAFVRENAPRKLEEENTKNAKQLVDYWMNNQNAENTQQTPKIRTDIQAALTVIGRRNCDNEKENQSLDLSNIDIRGANLEEANLQRVFLIEANLQGAFLSRANLQEAFLGGANLQDTNLGKANLQGANLDGANLQGAKLNEANLQGANLDGANLQGASLYGAVADLQGASLYEANLQEAIFPEANLQGTDLRKANLQGADLDEANLQGADLKGVENLEQGQIDEAKGDRTTKLPDHLKYPEHWQ